MKEARVIYFLVTAFIFKLIAMIKAIIIFVVVTYIIKILYVVMKI